MEIIDLRTIYLNFILTDLISFIFLFVLWYQNRKRYDGLLLIAIDFFLHFLAISLIFLRGYIPDFISIIVANFLGIISALVGLIGFSRFIGYKQKMIFNYILAFIFFTVHVYFTYICPSLATRNFNLGIAFFVFSLQTTYILVYKTPDHLKAICRSTAVFYVFFCLINLVRIVRYFFIYDESTQNYFNSDLYEQVIPLTYQITLLTLSFLIVLMVNKRLRLEISNEEKKLSIVYHTVPYATIITTKESNKIIEVNNGFLRIFGFTEHDIYNKTTLEINLWKNPCDRDLVIGNLSNNKQVTDKEFEFCKKSGEIIIGQYSCLQILVNNQECFLSVINDITLKKKNEIELLNSREVLKKIVLSQQSEHEHEKDTIATQLDNNLNQSLASLRLNIGMLKKKLVANCTPLSDEILQLLDSTYIQTGKTIEKSLSLMNRMRNEILYLFGFEDAVSFSLEEIEKKHKVKCTLQCDISKIELEQTKGTSLFLILQDIFNLILNYNKPRSIIVTMSKLNNNLRIRIIEKGKNINYFQDSKSKEAISIIVEKLGLLNGTFQLYLTDNDENVITIEAPL